VGLAEFSVFCSGGAEMHHFWRGESRRPGGGRAAGKDLRGESHSKP